MSLLRKAFKHLRNGTFILGLKNQPARFRKWKWEKFKNSNKERLIFKHRNLFRIFLYKDSELSQYIYQKNFEINEIDFISSFLRKGDVFIDVGTNIGFFSLMASRIVKTEGEVISFEPTTSTYNRLLENISLNKITNITPVQKGLSNENGFLEIYSSQDGYDAWNSFARPICGEIYNKEKVEIIQLDDFLNGKEWLNRLSLIKIDVEGWEKFVVEGGEKFLQENENTILLVEFVDQHTQNAGYPSRELYHKFLNLGYKIYNIRNKSLIPEPERDKYFYSNLVMVKNTHLLKERLSGWDLNSLLP